MNGEFTDRLAGAVLALEEPWRGRFLDLIFRWAALEPPDGRKVSGEELAAILRDRLALTGVVDSLMRAWRREWRERY